MPLNIPTSTDRLANWASELVTACQSSLQKRRQRGASFRNLYLTGSEDGQPQTYRKTYTYVQTLASMLYSPVELRFTVAPHGPAGPRDRAMGHAAATTLLEYMRGGNADTTVEDAVEWSLVKGKTFIQLEWSRRGIEAHMVQPETMGVLRDDITRLDRQDAFVHSTWLTEARFADHVADHPNRAKIMHDIENLAGTDDDRPDTADNARQVMIGGQLYPFRAQNTPGSGQGRGIVNWLQAPIPELDSKTMASLVRLDELWVWDRTRDDWTTIQLVGNVLIEPTGQFRNAFAAGAHYDKSGKRIARGEPGDDRNPLSGHHPFIEICANPLPDYFWGWSEMLNVGAIQMQINKLVDDINFLLRRQLDPSHIFTGTSQTAAKVRSALRRPGGYLVDSSPQFKHEEVAPKLPEGAWQSLHEHEAMFDTMAGFPPVMQGQGDSGVRAQGHAETLVRMASPRFKDRALGIERQVEEVGGLALDMLRAHCADMLPYWVKEKDVGPFKGKELDALIYEAPAPGMVALPFLMHQVSDRFRVAVDSHSASPAFSHDARELAILLLKAGALGPEELIRQTSPANEEEL